MKNITREELFALFDPSLHNQLERQLAKRGVSALVVFENRMINSSSFGARTAMAVGPGCTYKTVVECDGKYLHDLPSQRQYAVAYYQCKAKPPRG